VKTSVDQARTLLTDGAGASRHDEFLQHIDGLMFGDNPREGVVRGNTFLHPDMRFSIEFPAGWDIVNSAEQVAANEPGTKHYVFLDTARTTGNRRSLEEFARESARGAGFRSASRGTATQINGLDAWVGIFEGNLQDIGASVARIAVIEYERNVYRVIGIAPRDSFPKIEREVERTQQSFRGLPRDEALDIRPNRVQMYTVREGDTWQSIAQRAGGGNVKASTLAVMNGVMPNEQPRPGDRIKIVVAG
jgi:predicted Zn-dependent protease